MPLEHREIFWTFQTKMETTKVDEGGKEDVMIRHTQSLPEEVRYPVRSLLRQKGRSEVSYIGLYLTI